MERCKPLIGWREWVSLPSLNIDAIKVKVDTGAKTCALHAYYIEPYKKDGEDWVHFGIHPLQNNNTKEVKCHARLVDKRKVTDSGGHSENRFVIMTTVLIGTHSFDVEVTLTDRESMRFRMLLGRNALNGRFIVNSEKSFLLGKKPSKKTLIK